MDFKNLNQYTKNLTILYIEDEEAIRTQMEIMLQQLFFETHSADNGKLAFEMYNNYYEKNNKYYDLILSDIAMPQMNGIELSRNILKINPNQHIVIISAYSEKEKLQDLISLGINSYITKPINVYEFLEVLFEESRQVENHEKNNNKNSEKFKCLEQDYKKLEKEFDIYKENSNKHIDLLTQKNKIIYLKNSSSEKKILNLTNEIEDLKETIKQLQRQKE